MIYNCTRLVMCDLNCRFHSNAVPGPLDMPCDDVLGSLRPIEADHSGSATLWFSMFDTPVGELVHLFTSDRVLGQLHSRFKCNPDPWIGNVFIELLRVQSVDYAPPYDTTSQFSQPCGAVALSRRWSVFHKSYLRRAASPI